MSRNFPPLIICGPSGVGKGTITRMLLDADPRYCLSVSHTTRAPRQGEVPGTHYHFVSREEFEQMIAAKAFAEHNRVHDNYYGTSKQALDDAAAGGRVVILDIDVGGAKQIVDAGLQPLLVFLMPPSMQALEERLRGRGTESEEKVQRRLAAADAEVVAGRAFIDNFIVNDDLPTCFAAVRRLVDEKLLCVPSVPAADLGGAAEARGTGGCAEATHVSAPAVSS
eukprot:TRINITY_DN61023_c0_g1_i1.p1 TRINITY_DN61023_c0_g1~~TRINITY_DN61023_c0_g1_i1.p1  ORF type:complete len:257 (+),score=40.93 TRINITY_DN61023_c0_g1_i1:102-773(+)